MHRKLQPLRRSTPAIGTEPGRPAPVKMDNENKAAALSRFLEREPQSIAAHVELGDLRAGAGEDSLARHSYRTAIRIAERAHVPQDAIRYVRRAQTALAELEARANAAREALMSERGFPAIGWSPRFKHALEIAAGRRKVYAQEPTDFHYPDLPPIQFFDAGEFAWASAIEAAAGVIRDELICELQSGDDHFRAYLQGHSVSPEANNALFGKKDWSVLPLCENGWVASRAVARFPRTWSLVRQAPLPAIFGWGPTVVLSKLAAGAHIPAHNGMFNTRLICHLPLVVPPNCRFRVGNEVREWEVGKLVIFDDTIEHEAWNDGVEDRIILIFDVWRPELTGREKEELTALFHT